MKKILLIVVGIVLLLALLGGFVVWRAVVTQQIPSFVRFIPAFVPDLPVVPLTPEDDTQFDAPLIESVLYVPDRFAVGPFREQKIFRIPEGSSIGLFAAGLGKARMMAVSPEGWGGGAGVLHVTEQIPGRVLALPDADDDGVADSVSVVASGLENPNGIVFFEGALYVATETQVLRYRSSTAAAEIIVDGLPGGDGHVTRTIAFGDSGEMYVSVGSSCNLCEEDDPRRAAILRFNADGTGETIFASGSRNAVGIVFYEGQLWGTENGRDQLGDDIPPEEVNILREGRHYGWPYCYADGLPDRTFKATTAGGEPVGQFCPRTEKPTAKIQAHTAPLGLRFLTDARLPAGLVGDLLVALHGSWNRSEPVGHEVIRVSGLVPLSPSATLGMNGVEGPESPVVSTFVDFMAKGSRSFGRPVDAISGSDGALYITDDTAGAVYRLIFGE